ncbi:hypothetical protein M8C21_004385 [Ambrosia artemisiifolia]|uniref:Serine hydrolase domain-containing protein n=1 Tax=Ambrosia artemisiifolia TaxID=4212 RepID=A0AAD5BK09_AMBAR|nr:hypothetical protein M8C21_004385 [Ambrosia artemisiifolia]
MQHQPLTTPPLATHKRRLQFLHHTRRLVTRSNHSDTIINRNPRILCLHGFRTSGQIFKTQINKWPESVLEKVDLFFPNAPFDCNGVSGVEGVFDPPYYEWFQFHKDYKRYENFDECGAILAAALAGLQAKGLALTRVQKIGFLVIISGAKLKNEALAEKAYSPPIWCPSLHFLGDKDFLKPYGIELLKSFENPPRILCLHGFRTSGLILQTQLNKWPESVLEKLDLFFPDAPFPCNGKSEVEGIFDPPYYEWFQFNKGAILSAALAGLQAKVCNN